MRRHLKKKPRAMASQCSRSRPFDTPQLSLWSTLFCLLFSSAVSIANRLALAAKLLLQTITKELTLQCATRRGFCEVCSFNNHSFTEVCATVLQTLAINSKMMHFSSV